MENKEDSKKNLPKKSKLKNELNVSASKNIQSENTSTKKTHHKKTVLDTFWVKWKKFPFFKSTITFVGLFIFGVIGWSILGALVNSFSFSSIFTDAELRLQVGLAFSLVSILFGIFEVYFLILETIEFIVKRTRKKPSAEKITVFENLKTKNTTVTKKISTEKIQKK